MQVGLGGSSGRAVGAALFSASAIPWLHAAGIRVPLLTAALHAGEPYAPSAVLPPGRVAAGRLPDATATLCSWLRVALCNRSCTEGAEPLRDV